MLPVALVWGWVLASSSPTTGKSRCAVVSLPNACFVLTWALCGVCPSTKTPVRVHCCVSGWFINLQSIV